MHCWLVNANRLLIRIGCIRHSKQSSFISDYLKEGMICILFSSTSIYIISKFLIFFKIRRRDGLMDNNGLRTEKAML